MKTFDLLWRHPVVTPHIKTRSFIRHCCGRRLSAIFIYNALEITLDPPMFLRVFDPTAEPNLTTFITRLTKLPTKSSVAATVHQWLHEHHLTLFNNADTNSSVQLVPNGNSAASILAILQNERVRFRILTGALLFSKTSGPALGPTRPPVQSVPGLFPGYKATGAWHWTQTSY